MQQSIPKKVGHLGSTCCPNKKTMMLPQSGWSCMALLTVRSGKVFVTFINKYVLEKPAMMVTNSMYNMSLRVRVGPTPI